MFLFESEDAYKNFILSAIKSNEDWIKMEERAIENAKKSIQREKKNLTEQRLLKRQGYRGGYDFEESAKKWINGDKEKIKKCEQSIRKYKAQNAEYQQIYDQRYGKFANVTLTVIPGGAGVGTQAG